MANTHYAGYSVCPDQLADVAMEMHAAMRERWPDSPILLVYRGYSGASLGCAILTVAGISGDKLISGFFARKSNTEVPSHQHGSCPQDRDFIELHEALVVIVVDDFICSGRSVKKTWEKVEPALCWDVADKALFLWSNEGREYDEIRGSTGFEKVWTYRVIDYWPTRKKNAGWYGGA
jgi:hypothetical protein